MTDSQNTLAAALLKAQAAMPPLVTDSSNPHFRSTYLSLHGLQQAVLPVLNAHGLLWIAMPLENELGKPVLQYTLLHAETGESLEGQMPLLLGNQETSQSFGSAITYARRYALSAVLGLAADDDDGNAASDKKSVAPKVTKVSTSGGDAPATVAQRRLINARAQDAKLSPVQLANAITLAMGGKPVDYADESLAEGKLGLMLERLPKVKVDAVLSEIARIAQ
jgi:ERF superfamily